MKEVSSTEDGFLNQSDTTLQSDVYDKSQVDKFVEWTKTLWHIKYSLWDKDLWTGKWDCSALFAWYGFINNQWEFKTTQQSMNAQRLYEMGIKKDAPWYWDLMFFKKEWGWVNHIAMVVDKKLQNYEIIDLSSKHNVSKRWVVIDDGKFLADGESYSIYFASNILFDRTYTKQKMATINGNEYNIYYDKDNVPKEFMATVTTYIPKTNWDSNDINCWWGSCEHTADGTILNDKLAWKVMACPMQYPHWTRMMIEWFWVVECHDRWWLIVMKNDINTRWNVSSMNRLDVFAGMDESKIDLSKSIRKITVL